MTDNVNIPDLAINLATDDVAGVHYQVVKTAYGGADSATMMDEKPAANSALLSRASEATLASVLTQLTALLALHKAEDVPAVSGDLGLPLLAMRQLADTTSTSDDGDYTLLKVDEEGRVKVATKPASFGLVSGNITANAQTVSADVSRASNVQIHMVASSLSGHNITFEGSIDSTNGTDGAWFAIQVVRSNANTVELTSGVLAATPAYAWEASVNGLSFIRVRATAHTSGTATWKFQRGSYATEPIPAAQTQAVTGNITCSAGTSLIGDVGMQVRANATGATTGSKVLTAASTNATLLKATAGRVFSILLTNTTASVRVLHMHNLTVAPTVGSSVPTYSIVIPANGTVQFHNPIGRAHTTGISYSITTGIADLDATATAVGDVIGVIDWA